MTPRRYEQHVPGDGYGPDVDPVTGDEAETEELPGEVGAPVPPDPGSG